MLGNRKTVTRRPKPATKQPDDQKGYAEGLPWQQHTVPSISAAEIGAQFASPAENRHAERQKNSKEREDEEFLRDRPSPAKG